MKILALGEVVSKPGIEAIRVGLPKLKEKYGVDLTIVNGEGASGGFGINKNQLYFLRKLGVDVVTLGEKGFFKKEIVETIDMCNFALRPLNYPSDTPGKYFKTITIGEKRVTVICAMGQSGFPRTQLNNPFTFLNSLIEKLSPQTDIFVIEFHGATTAEKYTLLHLLKGKVAAIFGSHTKAITADLQISNGTGFICDVGRCGSSNSVGGLLPQIEIEKFITALPIYSENCYDDVELQGALFEIDENGKCVSTQLIKFPVEVPRGD